MESANDPLFWLHHSNIDRLWALWQDCNDYDKLNINNLPATAYEETNSDVDGIDRIMPYDTRHRSPVNMDRVTARDVYLLQIKYDPNDHLKLLCDRVNPGRCHWDWFKKPSVTFRSSQRHPRAINEKETDHFSEEKFFNREVEREYHQICIQEPFAPPEWKIYQCAIRECILGEGKPSADNDWIRMNNMNSFEQINSFIPICKP